MGEKERFGVAARVRPSRTEGALDIAEAPPEAPLVEVVEVEVAVELGGSLVGGVHDHGSGAELATASHATFEGVDEEVAAEPSALFGEVDGQARKENDWDWVGHPPPEAGWGLLVPDRVHRQCVVADEPSAPAHDVCGGSAGGGRDARGASQPLIELGDAAVKRVELVGVGERFDRTERFNAHGRGSGLRFRA